MSDDHTTPASWSALTTLTQREAAEELGHALEAMDPAPDGIGVFEMEDGSGLWEVGAYFSDPPADTDLAILSAAFDARAFTISEIPPTDWVAQVRRELHPVEAGRFFVYGAHDADRVPADRVSLLIEASMAFGTGHHGTTQGCLAAYDRLLTDGMTPGPVADIGAGTAVLAMAAAKVWPDVPVIATDIDAVAVDVAVANVAVNDLADRIACREAAGFDHPDLAGPFAVIFANILKGPLITLAPRMAEALVPGTGRAILSGLLNDQADDVAAAYATSGLVERDRLVIGDWTTLTLQRP